MIVPIIYSLNPVADNKMYIWVFLKAVSFARRYHWPVIAQEQYFANMDQLEQFCTDDLCERFEYDKVSEADLEKIIPVKIPKKIEKRYIKQFPSQTNAFLTSIRESWEEMERYLEQQIDILEEKCGEHIEAFITLPNVAFLDHVAKKKNIPVIHFEWGTFRPPVYRKTAYFNFTNVVTGLKQRYLNFCNEADNVKLPVFSKREILTLFVQDEFKENIFKKKNPSYEIGVATGYTTLGEGSAYNMVSAVEMKSRVNALFGADQVCWRMHPEDPNHAVIQGVTISDCKSAADFILDCKRIVCANSNMIYEAMLYDRIGYDIGFSHYAFMGNEVLEDLEDKKPDDKFISYVAFGYLIPYELLENLEYIRFRLGRPSETEIYWYHVMYYLNLLELDASVLMDREKRLEVFLQARGYQQEHESLKKYHNTKIHFFEGQEVKHLIEQKRKQKKCQKERVEKEVERLQRENAQLVERISNMDKVDLENQRLTNLIAKFTDKIPELERMACHQLQAGETVNISFLGMENCSWFYSQYKGKLVPELNIYYDIGNGYNETDKCTVPYQVDGSTYQAEIEMPENVRQIRLDMCETGERLLFFHDLQINGKPVEYEERNIRVINGKHSFVEKNPYIILKNIYKSLNLKLEIEFLSDIKWKYRETMLGGNGSENCSSGSNETE